MAASRYMVSRRLPRGTTLPATRVTPCAAISALTSGMSDKSMSASRIALTRGQSVLETAVRLEILEVEDLLMSGRLAHRNDAEFSCCFGMGHYHHGVAQHAERNEALLAIFESFIFERAGNALKHVWCVGEIQPVLSEIRTPLGLVPHNFHRKYY